MPNQISPSVLRRFDVQGFEDVPEDHLAEVSRWMGLPYLLCSALTLVGTLMASPTVLWILTPIAFLGAVLPFHPFDLLYNHGLRHLTGTRPLPRRGRPGQFACAIGTVWVATTAWCFQSGFTTVAYALGFALVAVATLVGTTHICIPSIIYRAVLGPPKPRAG